MPANRIWTIGHSTRSADEFITLLKSTGISGLADIRTIPRSRRHPHFAREALDARLEREGIEYRHFAGLGGLRKPRRDSPNGAWRNESFRGYADHMMTPEFSRAVEDLLEFAAERPVAVEVHHIMSKRGEPSLQPHRLTPFAHVESGAVSYPGLI
jgi:uncharacterized protein (DUF488 family)